MPDELSKAAKGLSYTSETDSPLHTFTWKDGGDLTVDKVRELTKTDPQVPIKEVTLDDFFSTQDDEGFDGLRKAIEGQLSEAKAFRIGEVNVRYYVVGKTKEGSWTGVWAKAVET